MLAWLFRLICHSFLVLIFLNALSCDNNSNRVDVPGLHSIFGSLYESSSSSPRLILESVV